MDYEIVLKAVDSLAGPLIEMSIGDIGDVFGDFVDDNMNLLNRYKASMMDPEVTELLSGDEVEDTILDNISDYPAIHAAIHQLLQDVIGTVGMFYDLADEDEDEDDDISEEDIEKVVEFFFDKRGDPDGYEENMEILTNQIEEAGLEVSEYPYDMLQSLSKNEPEIYKKTWSEDVDEDY